VPFSFVRTGNGKYAGHDAIDSRPHGSAALRTMSAVGFHRMTPFTFIFVAAAVFLLLERLMPGRSLPNAPGWYLRALALNLAQLGMVLLGGFTWSQWLHGPSLLQIDGMMPDTAQGFVCWFVGTFVFYWWHRARHSSPLLWRLLHQIHHSPSRIETLTAFYKHALEIMLNSILSTTIVFVLLGASVEAAVWYNLFAALGEFYYHANLRTPRWTGWFLQRPEHHSIHHQCQVHDYNYGDITWWDRLFGTFRETDTFVSECGYTPPREQRLIAMLAFRDINR
jgi:sterol desaturase/sphingolipid hydroxylase (fatty acid hydroxylase superfamily)